MKRRNKIAVVCIDYLQLITPDGGKKLQRYEEVGAISRKLKLMARDLALPVVCLAQLNRESENRNDKKPKLSDLRESGSIEQDADTVMLMSRPNDEQNVIDILVAKNRNGPTGEAKLLFHKDYMRFENYAAELPFAGGGKR